MVTFYVSADGHKWVSYNPLHGLNGWFDEKLLFSSLSMASARFIFPCLNCLHDLYLLCGCGGTNVIDSSSCILILLGAGS